MKVLENYPVWHPVTQMKHRPVPLKVVRGKGVWLELEDGRRVIDGISSWWVNLHGHAHPRILDAIYQQGKELEQVIFADFTHDPAIRVAERLSELLPGALNRVFFSDNGSTSVEIALKLALQFWQNQGSKTRRQFICFDQGYHGDTFGAMSVGAPSIFTQSFQDLLFSVRRVPYPALYESDQPIEEIEAEVLRGLRVELEAHGEQYAGIILEPLFQGAAGLRMMRPEFLRELEGLARHFDVLVIYDEVATGFGRTGDWFACTKAETHPDILCVSKGITGGFLPLAATVATDRIFDAFYSDDAEKGFYHSHSYMGNPLACAAANASLDLLQENPHSFKGMETRHRVYLNSLEGHPLLERIRCCGTVAAMDLRTEQPGGYLSHLGKELATRLLDYGVYLRPLGNVVYLMPPYCISDGELAHLYSALRASLDEL